MRYNQVLRQIADKFEIPLRWVQFICAAGIIYIIVNIFFIIYIMRVVSSLTRFANALF